VRWEVWRRKRSTSSFIYMKRKKILAVTDREMKKGKKRKKIWNQDISTVYVSERDKIKKSIESLVIGPQRKIFLL
jgi:hypothetical protein